MINKREFLLKIEIIARIIASMYWMNFKPIDHKGAMLYLKNRKTIVRN